MLREIEKINVLGYLSHKKVTVKESLIITFHAPNDVSSDYYAPKTIEVFSGLASWGRNKLFRKIHDISFNFAL